MEIHFWDIFLISGGNLGISGDIWGRFGGYLEHIWGISGGYLGDILGMSEAYLGDIWRMYFGGQIVDILVTC